MTLETDAIGLTTLILVMLPWLVVVLGLVRKNKRVNEKEKKRAPGSLWGMALQSISFALVWSLPRAMVAFPRIESGRNRAECRRCTAHLCQCVAGDSSRTHAGQAVDLPGARA